MKKAILARKVGMTQIFDENGVLIPVTVLLAGPCVVTQVKTEENDGYNSVQVAYGQIRTKLVNKAKAGHLAKAGIEKVVVENGDKKREIFTAGRFIREFKFENASEYAPKAEIKADIFAAGDKIDATAISKGKGWAGTIKRHNFKRHRKTHGGKGNTRRVGSIGSMYPQKIFKGKRMAGHMGAERVTVQNLRVAYLSAEDNLIGVKGAIPGPKKGTIVINISKKGAK